MHFSYRGFEQKNGSRQFTFLGLADKQPDRVFRFTVDLTLLTQHQVSIQETPSLCAELLAKALAEQSVDSYAQYALSCDDLLAFTAPRRALAASRGKKQWTRPKPSAASQPFTQAWGVAAAGASKVGA